MININDFIKENNNHLVSLKTKRNVIREGRSVTLENRISKVINVDFIEGDFDNFIISNQEVELRVDIDIINKVILGWEERRIIFEIRGDED